MKSKSNLSYYYGSMAATVAALIIGFMIGGWPAALIVSVLAILEISLSFDNAVVNSKILANWDDKWRKIFLTVGIVIAVFGMRLVFPILIVMVSAKLGLIETFDLAINKPDEYAHALHLAHPAISGFGGAFLAMVAMGFFFEEKHVYWLEWIETKLTKFGEIEAVGGVITLLTTYTLSRFMPADVANQFFMSSVFGFVTFVLAHGLGTLLGGSEESGDKVVKAGLAGFIYIEILDASFSFDGVIGAFALTNNIFIIMLGLMAGAFFVRSMTIHMVEKGTLAEFRYLEHGAFYGIAALAAIMLVSPIAEVPEVVTGLIGASMIIAALVHSIMANKADALTLTQKVETNV